MAHKTTTEQQSIPVAALVVALVVILGAGVFLYLDRASHRPPPPPPPLTTEAKAYVRSLKLMDVDMQKHESYMKQAVVEITGKIGNNGNRTLRVVEINCVFHDPYGQLVLRKRVPIVGQKMGGLAPGEIKNFRLAFDDIPDSWNQALPELVIAQIVFG
ncbi:MAG: FxLYD domain-containing protein [Bryobacteraceae bacterium]